MALISVEVVAVVVIVAVIAASAVVVVVAVVAVAAAVSVSAMAVISAMMMMTIVVVVSVAAHFPVALLISTFGVIVAAPLHGSVSTVGLPLRTTFLHDVARFAAPKALSAKFRGLIRRVGHGRHQH